MYTEAVGRIANGAIRDNTTPAGRRSGATTGYTGNGAVRGGLLVLEKLMPDLAAGYMRFYLRELGRPIPAGDPRAAFEAAFPLPDAIVKSMRSAIESILAGI